MTFLALLLAFVADPPADKFAEARRLVAPIQVKVGADPVPAELVPDPVLTFSDPTQNHIQGHVWLWGKTGRPAAIMEVYRNAKRDVVYVGHTLTTEAFDASSPKLGFRWRPDAPDHQFAPLPGAPAPLADAKARLLQMKDIVGKFSAHLSGGGKRHELRLLPTPIRRYADEKCGIVDGALFAFVAGGTNPDVVVALEAATVADKTVWRWAAVRMGHAESHLLRHGAEIWSRRGVQQPSWRDAYGFHYLVAANAPVPAAAQKEAKK